MQQYIERLAQSRNEIFEEASRKRALPTEPTDVVDSAKRARLGVDTPPQLKIPPLPPGPTSFAQLFTLTEDVGLTSFDVKQLPIDLIVRITVPVLGRVDPESLDQAIGVSYIRPFKSLAAAMYILNFFLSPGRSISLSYTLQKTSF
jgi:symplekin